MKTLKVPNHLGEITLKQYQEFASKGEEVTNEEIVSIFCKITLEEVLQLPAHAYEQAVVLLGELLQQSTTNQELIQTFKLNGTQYGMIPNLEEITYGENKDLVAYLADWKTMHMAMSVLFRPIDIKAGQTYSIEKYEGTSSHRDIMIHMPLDIVMSAQSFFYNLTEALLHAIPSYLEQVQRESNSKTVQSSKDQQTQEEYIKQTGDPMMKSIALLRETLEGLKR